MTAPVRPQIGDFLHELREWDTLSMTLLTDSRPKGKNISEDEFIPNLFLSIGAMKAGTTWLSQVLRQHPQIRMSPEKELHFLYHWYVERGFLAQDQRIMRSAQIANRYRNTKNPKIQTMVANWLELYCGDGDGWAWYKALLSPRRNAYVADFSNLTCHLRRQDWEAVRQHTGRLRAIYVLRNPYDRIWSHLRFHLGLCGRLDELPQWSAEQFKAAILEDHMWSNNQYARNITELRAGTAPEESLILFHDDVEADSKGTVARIADFLGLPDIWQDNDAAAQHLDRRINVSPDIGRPAYFLDILRPLVEPELDRLEALGLTLPSSWRL